MRIIYCGVYREESGYGLACREYITALHKAGADIVCRPAQFSYGAKTKSDLIKSLEAKNFDSPADVIIQHCPPYCFQYMCPNKELNVGIFYTETSPLPKTWMQKVKLVDLIISPNELMTSQLASANVNVEKVHIPTNMEKYKLQYEVPEVIQNIREKKRTIFYAIGEYCKRKNFLDIVRGFCSEFKFYESVALVLKTKIELKQFVDEIKNGIKIERFPEIYCISDYLSEEELMGLHQACDVFVQPSMGEAHSLPALDAIMFGKPAIVSESGGFLEYVNNENGYLIPTQERFVFGEGPIHRDIFTGNQKWHVPNFELFRKAMREAHENRNVKKHIYPDFSYGTIGNHFMKVLEKHVNKKRAKGTNSIGKSSLDPT